jgi:hypothetical protein
MNLNSSSDLIEKHKSQKRYKSSNLNFAKKEFLDFLIQEETNFADFQNVENFYQGLRIKNENNFNANHEKIKRKEEELKYIDNQIEALLITNLQIDYKDKEKDFENQINEIKEQIKIREHDLECYKHMYDRLYRTNVSIILNEYKFYYYK